MTYEEFRNKYEDAIKELDNIDSINIFKILRLDNYEIRHSNFLIWLLKKDEFRKLFIRKCCNIGEDKLKDTEFGIKAINREEFFQEVNCEGKMILSNKNKTKFRVKGSEQIFKYKTENDSDLYEKISESLHSNEIEEIKYPYQRYIDINIIGEKYTLTIENKVDAVEHDLQCVAYRNYMKNQYKDQDNYFVFLAKNKPQFFHADNPKSKYYEYIPVEYTGENSVKAVLQEYVEHLREDSFESMLVKQYIEVIDSWNNFPDDYKRIFEKVDLRKFYRKSDYENLLKIAITDSEKNFIQTAHRYCVAEQAKKNEQIHGILKELVKKKYHEKLINGDYSNTKDTESVNYGYALNVPRKETNLKEFDIFQSVDYTNLNGLQIALYLGLGPQKSRAMIQYIEKNSQTFISGIGNLLEDTGWKVCVNYIVGSASNYMNRGQVGILKFECENVDKIKKLVTDFMTTDSCLISPNKEKNKKKKNDCKANNKKKLREIIDKITKDDIYIKSVHENAIDKINAYIEKKDICAGWSIEIIYNLEKKEIDENNREKIKKIFRDQTEKCLNIFADFGTNYADEYFVEPK